MRGAGAVKAQRDLKSKDVAVTPRFQAAWTTLVEAVGAAVEGITESGRLPLSPFYAHDLPGSDVELTRALKVSEDEADTASASFQQGPEHRLYIRVLWIKDPEVVKRRKAKA